MMVKIEPTPGPWRLVLKEDAQIWGGADGKSHVASLHCDEARHWKMTLADGLLLAAAPSQRAVLEAVRPIIANLIAAEHNVETWALRERLAEIDAALNYEPPPLPKPRSEDAA